jgi:PAS domain S-box-containing protein
MVNIIPALEAISYSEIYAAIQSSCLMILTDKNGVILSANKKFSDLCGYSHDELIGKKYNFLAVNDALPQDFFLFWNCIAGGSVFEFEVHNKAKNGELFWTKNAVIPVVEDETKRQKGFLSIITDITLRKKSEQDAEQFREQLLQSQKIDMIGQLASGVAHDFNNILMPIIGFTRMGLTSIEKHDLTKATDCLTRVEKSANRAADLVEKILLFSRENTVKAEYPIDPATVINEVIDISSLLRSGIGASVSILLDDSETKTNKKFPSVLIDSSELYQILTNLIVNARDAIMESSETNFGKIKIRLRSNHILEHDKIFCSACKENLNGEYVVISIMDSGCGMPVEKITRIFEPFFTTKRDVRLFAELKA